MCFFKTNQNLIFFKILIEKFYTVNKKIEDINQKMFSNGYTQKMIENIERKCLHKYKTKNSTKTFLSLSYINKTLKKSKI